jgi:Uma2 family endonuclease
MKSSGSPRTAGRVARFEARPDAVAVVRLKLVERLLPSSMVLDLNQFPASSLRPIRRAEYDRLVASGFFSEDERVELLYGVLVLMAPQDPAHSSVIEQLNHLLLPALVGRARVRIQLPFAASDESEPEPDVAVVPPGDYRTEHPKTAHLIVEVANTSHQKDRTVKGRLYAECGVREYWLVDVPARTVEVHTAPARGIYSSVINRTGADRISLVAFADVVVAVDDVFAA